jgi:hypothetical protein
LQILHSYLLINLFKGAGKVVSLEELEARMRGGVPSMPQPDVPKMNKTEEDLSAFKKLVSRLIYIPKLTLTT